MVYLEKIFALVIASAFHTFEAVPTFQWSTSKLDHAHAGGYIFYTPSILSGSHSFQKYFNRQSSSYNSLPEFLQLQLQSDFSQEKELSRLDMTLELNKERFLNHSSTSRSKQYPFHDLNNNNNNTSCTYTGQLRDKPFSAISLNLCTEDSHRGIFSLHSHQHYSIHIIPFFPNTLKVVLVRTAGALQTASPLLKREVTPKVIYLLLATHYSEEDQRYALQRANTPVFVESMFQKVVSVFSRQTRYLGTQLVLRHVVDVPRQAFQNVTDAKALLLAWCDVWKSQFGPRQGIDVGYLMTTLSPNTEASCQLPAGTPCDLIHMGTDTNTLAAAILHKLGHTFGMIHDDTSRECSPNGVMRFPIPTNLTQYSQCSLTRMEQYLALHDPKALFKPNATSVTSYSSVTLQQWEKLIVPAPAQALVSATVQSALPQSQTTLVQATSSSQAAAVSQPASSVQIIATSQPIAPPQIISTVQAMAPPQTTATAQATAQAIAPPQEPIQTYFPQTQMQPFLQPLAQPFNYPPVMQPSYLPSIQYPPYVAPPSPYINGYPAYPAQRPVYIPTPIPTETPKPKTKSEKGEFKLPFLSAIGKLFGL